MNNIIGLARLNRFNIKSMLVFFCLALNPLSAIVVMSAEFSKQFVVISSVEHDSNPNLSDSNIDPVWIYTLSPQLNLAVDDQVNRWYLNASVLYQEPSNQKIMIDRQDPSLGLGWDRIYDTGKYGVRFNYSQASSRSVELKNTGVFRDINNTQKIKSISANWLQNINDRWSLLTEANYTDVLFTLPGNLQNNRVRDIRTKLFYENNEKLTTNLLFDYMHLRPEKQFKPTDLFRLRTGADYQMTDSWTISSYAGLFKLSGSQKDTGWEAGVKIGYVNERSSYGADISRENSVGGIGGSQIVDTYGLRWLLNRSPFDRMGMDYGLSKSKDGAGSNLAAIESRQIGAFYEHDLTSSWTARIYTSFRNQITDTADSHGNLIGISLSYDTLNF